MPRASRVIGLIAAAVLPVVALVAVAGPADASAVRLCVPVHAVGTGQDQGADPQGNLHTTATISVLGFAVGTTNATFTPSPPPVGTVLSFAGPIVFTPRFGPGTLTAATQGSVDLATGTFTATSTAVSGTGPFQQVSGQLTFAGTEDLTTGAFTETVTGRLCATGRTVLTPAG